MEGTGGNWLVTTWDHHGRVSSTSHISVFVFVFCICVFVFLYNNCNGSTNCNNVFVLVVLSQAVFLKFQVLKIKCWVCFWNLMLDFADFSTFALLKEFVHEWGLPLLEFWVTIISFLSLFVTFHCNQCLKCFLLALVTESWLIATNCNRFVILCNFRL